MRKYFLQEWCVGDVQLYALCGLTNCPILKTLLDCFSV